VMSRDALREDRSILDWGLRWWIQIDLVPFRW